MPFHSLETKVNTNSVDLVRENTNMHSHCDCGTKLCSISVDLLCGNAVMSLKSIFFISVLLTHHVYQIIMLLTAL